MTSETCSGRVSYAVAIELSYYIEPSDSLRGGGLGAVYSGQGIAMR